VDRDTSLKPIIYLWNIPDNYDATVFSSVDDIIDSITKSQNWWVRRHGIEVSKRLYTIEEPWSGVDDYYKWFQLESEIKLRWKEFISIFQKVATDDDCPLVRESASLAFDAIKLPEIEKCISDSIIDNSSEIGVKFIWQSQLRVIKNYKLRVDLFVPNIQDYINFYLDSTLTDTTVTINNFSNGLYSWIVYAKNDYGWSPDNGNFCSITISTSDVPENNSSNKFFISPNPATDLINIKYNFNENTSVKIIDALGISIYSNKNILAKENSTQINMEEFPPGIYFCIINDGITIETKKFLVIR
jgi:hypothetical protein